MEKLDRLQQLHRILSSRRTPISKRELAERLECTERSVTRYLDELRDRFFTPLEYEQGRGWYYSPDKTQQFELPGLWLTEGDIQSLLLLLDILQSFSNGLINQELQAIEKRINQLLEERGIERSELDAKVRIIPQGNRVIPDKHLYQVFAALMANKQLNMVYSDYSNRKTQRSISPQRLVYYRDNWYLDAWCHLRNELRSFSLARTLKLYPGQKNAKAVPVTELDAYFNDGYGVFAGEAKYTAKLRFFPEIAREIAKQQWHPQQQGEWDGNDYLLSFPYSDDRELIQDILRHTPHVYVEAPAALRKKVQTRLQSALAVFTGGQIGV